MSKRIISLLLSFVVFASLQGIAGAQVPELPELPEQLNCVDLPDIAGEPQEDPPAPYEPGQPVCTGTPSLIDPHPSTPGPYDGSPQGTPDGEPSESTDQPSPQNPGGTNGPQRFWMGTQTSNHTTHGIYATMSVVNPNVQQSMGGNQTDDFFASRVLVKNCDASRWLEVGYAKTGIVNSQTNPGPYVYVRTPDGWEFWFNFTLQPGAQSLPVELLSLPNGNWGAYAYRTSPQGNYWWLLKEYDLGSTSACGTEAFVQADWSDSGQKVSFPTVYWGSGFNPDFPGVYLRNQSGTWAPWDLQIPTSEVLDPGIEPFRVCMSNRYQWWSARGVAYPPVWLNFDATSGAPATEFRAFVGADACQFQALEFEIDWGDGAFSFSQSGGHSYSATGTYTVVARVTGSGGMVRTAQQQVTVCAGAGETSCPNTDPAPSDPCTDTTAPCPTGPPTVTTPQETNGVETMAEDAQTQFDDAFAEAKRNVPFSPNEEVLAVTVNAEQIYVESADPARIKPLARRIVELATKTTGDGMGAVPDILLLEEVSWAAVKRLRRALSGNEGFTYEVAAANRTHEKNIPGTETKEAKKCQDEFPDDSTKQQQCVELVFAEGSNAILYNSATMKKVSESHFDAMYKTSDRGMTQCSSSLSYPSTPLLDADEDGEDDCRVKWMRNYSALLSEVKLDSSGDPTKGKTGVRVAASAVHLVEQDLLAEHRQKKKDWAEQAAAHFKREYKGVDVSIIGGDFNVHRCENKVSEEPGDYPSGGTCDASAPDWWSALRSTAGFDETVYELHSSTDDRLVPQYRDGCDELSQSGECTIPNESHRRIDFLFTKGLPLIASSRDLSCGEVQQQDGVLPNCDDDFNRSRYSNHRLVWVKVGN